MNRDPFRCEWVGAFYTAVFYDERGREIFDLATAAAEAERQYGEGWSCVYNGHDAIDRESWLKQEAQ